MRLLNDFTCKGCRITAEHYLPQDECPSCPLCALPMTKILNVPRPVKTLGQKLESVRGHLRNYRRDPNLTY